MLARNQKIIFIVSPVLCVLVLLWSASQGMVKIPIVEVLMNQLPPKELEIFWKLRLPRVALGFIAGAGLSVGGLVFQSIFRNPLATPYTLGVSSGAAFGAVLYYQLGFSFSLFGISGSSFAGVIGGLATTALVYSAASTKRDPSGMTLLLAGVVASFFFSSLIMFLQYLSDFAGLYRMTRWLMGGFEVVGFDTVWAVLPFVLFGSLVAALFSKELNLLLVGSELATARGMKVELVTKILFVAISLMIGGIVSFCGPIGFVGMMVPHIARLIFGYDHRLLVPVSILGGGVFLVLSDTLARSILAPFEIPVGVITALMGGPFFLWLLLRKARIPVTAV